MKVWKRSSRRFLIIVVCLLASVGIVMAQGGPTPITLGENVIGQVTTGSTTFVLASAGGESVEVQLYPITAGFSPFLRVLSPSGGELLNQVGVAGAATLGGTVPLATSGNYTIEVSSAGVSGEFLLSVQPAAALPPPDELAGDQPMAGELSAENPLQIYHFNTTDQSGALLTINASSASAAPLLTVRDGADGRTVAQTDSSVVSAAFQFAPGGRSYIVEIQHNGVSAVQTYSLCAGSGVECWRVIDSNSYINTYLGNSSPPTQTAYWAGLTTRAASDTLTLTPQAPTEGPTACRLSSSTGGTVNIRSGPGTNAGIIGALVAGQTLAVTGTVPDSSWYQINQLGSVGWVGATVVQLQGNCAGVPVVGMRLPPMIQAPAPTQPLLPTEPPPANLVVGVPDLVISSANAIIDPNAGTTITVTVSNIGTAEAGANELQVQFPDSNIEQRMIGPLAPGASTTQTFTNAAALAAGDWQANVDATGVINELSDSNNNASGFVQFNS